MAKIAEHCKTLRAPEAILDYGIYDITRIILDQLKDGNVLITAVSRKGDCYILRVDPSGKSPKADIWNYEIHSAYDVTHVVVGNYTGDWTTDNDDDDLEFDLYDILYQLVTYDGPAISPRDKDGFLRLRPRAGVKFDGRPYMINDRSLSLKPTINFEVKRSKYTGPVVEMKVNRVGDKDVVAMGIIQYLHTVGDRIAVYYRDESKRSRLSHSFSPFDYDEEPFGLDYRTRDTVIVIGDVVDAILDDVSEALGLDRVLQNSYYGFLCTLWASRASYDGMRPNNRRYFNAILT